MGPGSEPSLDAWRPSPVAAWVLSEGRREPELGHFFANLCTVLARHGVMLARMACGVPTLHPQIHAVTWQWSEGDPRATAINRPHGIEALPEYLHSPIAAVDRGAPFVRRRLEGDATFDFPILRELAGAGLTDYLAMPLAGDAQGRYAITFATAMPGGFSDAALALLFNLEPALAVVLQVHAHRRIARSLLATYLGRDAGERVLEGRVLRGDSETIGAVLWYCDMRDFTPMSETRPTDEVIRSLNDYFACMGEPVETRGGEILKFIGDAVLGIFRIGERFPRAALACAAAMEAADDAFARLDALNRHRGDPLRCGLALHLGDVRYGNVGTPERLDFTVIGPAVNLASRLSDLCKKVGERLLVSEAFAAHAEHRFRDRGAHPVRGMRLEQRVFSVA